MVTDLNETCQRFWLSSIASLLHRCRKYWSVILWIAELVLPYQILQYQFISVLIFESGMRKLVAPSSEHGWYVWRHPIKQHLPQFDCIPPPWSPSHASIAEGKISTSMWAKATGLNTVTARYHLARPPGTSWVPTSGTSHQAELCSHLLIIS